MKTNDYKIQGFDYCEFYVGNAKQTTHYYQTTMGFQLIAYRGLETGSRDRVSYVLNQNKINLVITAPLKKKHKLDPILIYMAMELKILHLQLTILSLHGKPQLAVGQKVFLSLQR